MEIHENKFNFTRPLTTRNKTNMIVLHHEAGHGNVSIIHEQHINQGWSGIGYHFFITRKGVIERCRPEEKIGAHCVNYNATSLGICFEGNMEVEDLTDEQIASGKQLLKYLYDKYNLSKANCHAHRELNATACPGRNFPLDEMKRADMSNAEIIKKCRLYKKANSWSGFLCSVEQKERILVLQNYKFGWSRVEYDGKTGYIKNSCLIMDNGGALYPYPTRKTTESVWLRSSRMLGTKNRIVLIPDEDKFILLEKGSKWLYVKYDGHKGYILKKKTNVK